MQVPSRTQCLDCYRGEIEGSIVAVSELKVTVHSACVWQEVITQRERAYLLGLMLHHQSTP